MLSSFIYGARKILLMKEIKDSSETDYSKQGKVVSVKRRLIISSIITVVSIIILFIWELIRQ